MAKLTDLDLGKDKIDHGDLDTAHLPEQMGMRPRMLQPGPYIFRLPLLAAIRESYSAFDAKEGDKDVKRMAAVFQDGAELFVVQAPNKEINGTLFRSRVSNNRRPRGKKEDPKTRLVSDFDYLLQVLGEPTLPSTNPGYAAALEKHAGENFGADIELNWSCNAKKPVRVPADETSNQLVTLDGEEGQQLRMGCGARFYERDVPKDPQSQEFPARIDCECGAVLYANENLTRFRKAKAG